MFPISRWDSAEFFICDIIAGTNKLSFIGNVGSVAFFFSNSSIIF